MSIIVALLMFGIIVVIHEFGHFIVARKCGILVEEFAVGMGPVIFKSQKGETLYTLRLLPIGGFCRMLGEDSEASNTDKRAFNNKTVFQRILVISAGAFMNFILAFVLFFLLSCFGWISLPVINSVLPDSAAAEANLQKGDRILKLNNTKINIYEDLAFELDQGKGNPLSVLVQRGNERLTVEIVPRLTERENGTQQYLIGFECEAKTGIFTEAIEGLSRATFFETVKQGAFEILFYIKVTLLGAIRLFTFQASTDEMAGVIGIVDIIGTEYKNTIIQSVWLTVKKMAAFVAMISANIGVFNLLPLPALDGGRLAFLIVEGIRRKPIDREKEGMIHFAGFVLLMILAIFIAYNDIMNLI